MSDIWKTLFWKSIKEAIEKDDADELYGDTGADEEEEDFIKKKSGKDKKLVAGFSEEDPDAEDEADQFIKKAEADKAAASAGVVNVEDKYFKDIQKVVSDSVKSLIGQMLDKNEQNKRNGKSSFLSSAQEEAIKNILNSNSVFDDPHIRPLRSGWPTMPIEYFSDAVSTITKDPEMKILQRKMGYGKGRAATWRKMPDYQGIDFTVRRSSFPSVSEMLKSFKGNNLEEFMKIWATSSGKGTSTAFGNREKPIRQETQAEYIKRIKDYFAKKHLSQTEGVGKENADLDLKLSRKEITQEEYIQQIMKLNPGLENAMEDDFGDDFGDDDFGDDDSEIDSGEEEDSKVKESKSFLGFILSEVKKELRDKYKKVHDNARQEIEKNAGSSAIVYSMINFLVGAIPIYAKNLLLRKGNKINARAEGARAKKTAAPETQRNTSIRALTAHLADDPNSAFISGLYKCLGRTVQSARDYLKDNPFSSIKKANGWKLKDYVKPLVAAKALLYAEALRDKIKRDEPNGYRNFAGLVHDLHEGGWFINKNKRLGAWIGPAEINDFMSKNYPDYFIGAVCAYSFGKTVLYDIKKAYEMLPSNIQNTLPKDFENSGAEEFDLSLM